MDPKITFTILVVDDHPGTLVAVEAALSSLNYNIITAKSGHEALRYLLHNSVDLILLDVRMADMDGLETAAMIRKRKQTESIPIIFMSAIDKADSQVFEGYRAGAIDYIFKPFDPAILRAKVSVFVDLFKKTVLLERMNEELKEEIKERRLAEDRLQNYKSQLEGLVEERTAQLRQANEQLQMDIIERKRAEDALRESEDRYRKLFEEDLTGDFVASASGQILICNQSFANIYGFESCEEAIGNNLANLILQPERWTDYVRLLEDRRILERYECDRQRRDGMIIHVVENVIGTFDDQGKLTQLKGYVFDDTEHKHAVERIQASLREKEVMLKEIHHRVKNNLQVISSLISLQVDGGVDGQDMTLVLEDVHDRVRTMALVHEKLYQSKDLARVDFAEYARSLMQYLWRAHGTAAANVHLQLDLQPLQLSVESAVPCGLILNELASNTLKHAFRDRDDGEVTVTLRTDTDGRACLSVRDNGVGLPANLDLKQPRTLGLRLVQMLSGQLNGTMEISNDEGTQFRIIFAEDRAKEGCE